MLTRSSRPRLSPSLERRAGEAFDRAMRRRIGLNGTAEFVMDGMDGTRSLSRIAAEMSAAFGIPEDVALKDTISFTERLQEYGVVDTSPTAGETLRHAILSVLVRGRNVPGRRTNTLIRRRRVDVRGSSFVGILAQIAPRVSSGLLCPAGLLALALGWFTLTLTGDLTGAILLATGPAFALVLGVSLHESAHLYTLRRCMGDESLGYVRISAFQISVVYPNLRPEKNFWVSVAGPLCPVVCGAVLYCVNVFHNDPLIAISAFVLVAHTTSYLPIPGSDGMNLLTHASYERDEARQDPAAGPSTTGRWEER